MNQLAAFKKPLKTVEIATLVVFIIYLLFPFRMPDFIASLINSPLGFLAVFAVSIYFFLTMHPVVGILYLFVAYELVRRSIMSPAASSEVLGSCKTNMKMNPVNETKPLETDKELGNYKQSIQSAGLGILDQEYAPIGLNSNEAERARELARINPPVQVGESLEERVIRERVPANSLHPNVIAESAAYVPVYGNTSCSHSSV